MLAYSTLLGWVGGIGMLLAAFFGHKRLDRWKAFVFAFGIISLIASTWSQIDADQMAQDLAAKNDRILEVTTEAATEQRNVGKSLIQKNEELAAKSDDIASLNREIAAKNEEIADISREMANTMVGGSSYPSIVFMGTDAGVARVLLVNHGAYPLYDLSFQVTDLAILDKMRPVIESAPTVSAFLKAIIMNYHAATLGPNQSLMINQLTLDLHEDSEARYNVQFVARNGDFSQAIRMKKVSGTWVTAYKVSKVSFDGAPVKELLVQIDSRFPKGIDGNVEW